MNQNSVKLPPAWIVPPGRWMSRATQSIARSHFVLGDGRPLCAMFYGAIYPAVLTIDGPWTSLDEWRHVCGLCRHVHPNALPCMCPRCRTRSVRRAAPP